MGDGLEPAAVRADRPGAVAAGAVGIEEDARAVGEPERDAVLGGVAGELARDAAAVRAHHEEVLLGVGGIEGDPLPVR